MLETEHSGVTQLDFAVGKFVQTRGDCRQLVANSVYTPPTRLNSTATTAESRCRRRCVLGFNR